VKVKNTFQKKYILNLVMWVIIVFAIAWYARPRPFDDIMLGFDSLQITGCEAIYHFSDIYEGKPKYHYQTRFFELNSDDYKELLELLKSTTYRRQFANLVNNGTSQGYSVTLNPYASIYFYQGDERYEFSMFGQDVSAGSVQDRYDYTPRGGKDFQRKVVEFISKHGILLKEY